MTCTTTVSTAACAFLACPVYTPFARVETFINSQQVDSVQDYNVVAHAWSNLFLGVNEKYGNQFGFGYVGSDEGMDKLDGRSLGTVNTTTSFFASAPLVCTKLTGCEKFIPAFATGGIRLIFTLDTFANMFNAAFTAAVQTAGATPTAITNFEVV